MRLVVIEGSVRSLNPAWATYAAWTTAFQACRSAGQELYGYVPVNHGNRNPTDVAAEVDAWKNNVGAYINGIYLDEGPISCQPQIATNYRAYAAHIRALGLKLFVLAPQWPDDAKDAQGNPDPWLRSLSPEYIQLWEAGVVPYRTQYGAIDYCATQNVIPPPSWWTTIWKGPFQSAMTGRVHAINDCTDAATMRQLINESLGKRAYTVWVTNARQDPQLRSVYDELPFYWNDMVGFIRTF